MTFELDLAGGGEVLKELSRAAIDNLAAQIAGQAGADAKVKTYTTDRAAATVTVPAEQQAKDGVLTKAAAAAGLEVRLKVAKPKAPRKPRKKPKAAT